jgi:hypothetical protein
LEAFLREAIEAKPRWKKTDMMTRRGRTPVSNMWWVEGCNANLEAELRKSGGILKEQ